MFSNKLKLVLCAALIAGSAGIVNAKAQSDILAQEQVPTFGINPHGGFSVPAQPLATPPGMVPMIVYVPAQQMQPAVPPHTHAPTPPQAAQKLSATHCSINDVAVLTQDAPSCQKAGGKVVAERASFRINKVCKSGKTQYLCW